MSHKYCMALSALGAVCLAVLIGTATGEEPPAGDAGSVLPARAIWNASHAGRRGEGQFVELTDPEDPQHGERWLVVTDLDVRTASGVYVRVVERRKKTVGERSFWETVVRRPAEFMRDFSISTTGVTGSTFESLSGLKVAPGSRLGLEIVQGKGDVWVQAEGYWTGE